MNRPPQIILTVASLVALIAGPGCDSASDPLQEARRLWLQGKSEQARPVFERRLEAHPTDHETRIEFAKRLTDEDPAAAVTHLQKIPDDSPLAFEAARQVFAIASNVHDDRLKEDSLLRMERLQPDDPAVILSLAEHFYHTMQMHRAEQYARRALNLNDGRAETWLLLAEVLDELGRTAESVAPLQQALARNQNDYAIRANLAYALQFAGQLKEAQEHVDWCLQRKPNDVSLLGIQAAVHRAEGRYEQALSVVRRATELQPDHLHNRLLEADLLIYQREGDAAYRILKPLLNRHPNDRPLLAALARAAAISGRREEAAEYQQRIAALIEESTRRESGGNALQAPDTLDAGG